MIDVSKLTEQQINDIAKKYYEASKSEKAQYFNSLYKILTEESILCKKIKAYLRTKWNKTDPSETKDIIIDYIWEMILKYDYNKNDNFTAYCLTYISWYMSDIYKKEKDYEYLKEPDNAFYDEKGEEKESKKEPAEPFDETTVVLYDFCAKLINFWEHSKSGALTKTKLSYYKIFIAERLIFFFYDFDSTKYFSVNKSEVYEATDHKFIRFISFSDYKSIDDLIGIKLKNKADLLPDCTDNDSIISKVGDKDNKKEMDIINNHVIVEYRFVSELDIKKVSPVMASSERKKFLEHLKDFK